MKLIFEKSISRDWSVLYTQMWYESYIREFKKQFGQVYSEVIYEGKEGSVEGFRAPIEHIDGLREFVLGKLKKDPSWLSKQSKILIEETKETINFANKIRERPLSEYSNKDLAELLKKFFELNIKLGPRFIITFWFPIHMEKHPDLRKYKDEIKAASEARNISEKLGSVVDPSLREIGRDVLKRANLPEDLSKFINYEEIITFLEKGQKIDVRKIAQRKDYFIVANKGILIQSMKEYLSDHEYGLKEEVVEQTSEIKGSIAYPGLVKGKAILIKNKEMFNKFKEGDIVITSMTNPDYLPILRNALAFVTDEGGITCHAAIAARELKKPCIIGTKIATKVLKDGDVIEVDANKGVVRKLR